MALVWALGPGQLTVEPSPAWLTVALPIHTDAVVGARRIQAIHLCTVLPFVANGAHTVSISAGAMAAAKRVYALRDRDVALGSFPAAVTHTGALVVLAVAAAQHWACRFGAVHAMESWEAVAHTRITLAVTMAIARALLH